MEEISTSVVRGTPTTNPNSQKTPPCAAMSHITMIKHWNQAKMQWLANTRYDARPLRKIMDPKVPLFRVGTGYGNCTLGLNH